MLERLTQAGRTSQAGNVFFTLFGAVGLVGVLGASTMGVMNGPVRSMHNVTQRTIAENNMIAAGKLALMSAVNQPDDGDCDADGIIEPIPFSTTGTGPFPTGGGYLPDAIGAAKQDPWGTTYGYCAWDHGSVIRNGTCPGDAGRLSGSADNDGMALAVIAAGPDRLFQTACGNGPDYVLHSPGSDDVVLAYTYEEAGALSGGLWNLKMSDPETAEIAKDLEVRDSATGDVVFGVDSASDPNRPAIKVDYIQQLSQGAVEYLSNIALGGNWLSGDGGDEGIYIGNNGYVGIGTNSPQAPLHTNSQFWVTDPAWPSGSLVNIGTPGGSTGMSFTRGDGDGGTLKRWDIRNDGTGLYFVESATGGASGSAALTLLNAGNVGIGTEAPTARLDIAAKGDGASVLRLNTERPWQFTQFGAGSSAQMDFHPTIANKAFNIKSASGGTIATFNAQDNVSSRRILLNPEGGLVGIGTPSPSSMLHVAGDGRFTGGGHFDGDIRTDSRAIFLGADQRLYGDNSSALYWDSNNASVAQLVMRNSADAETGRLYSHTARIGLQEPGGTWSYRADYGSSTMFYVGGDIRMRLYPTYLHMYNNQIRNLANPTSAQDATTKSYVDARVAAGTGFVEQDPKVGATTNGKWCRGTGAQIVCDQDTPLFTGTGDGRYVRKSGDTMTGNLWFSGGTRYIGTSSNNAFVIRSNNTNRITIANSGDVSVAQNLILGQQGTATNQAVRADRTITAGTGLTGGGNLVANRTINFDTSWGDSRYLRSESDPQVGTLTNGRWCRSNGSQVICDQAAPSASVSRSQPNTTIQCAADEDESCTATGSVSCASGSLIVGCTVRGCRSNNACTLSGDFFPGSLPDSMGSNIRGHCNISFSSNRATGSITRCTDNFNRSNCSLQVSAVCVQ